MTGPPAYLPSRKAITSPGAKAAPRCSRNCAGGSISGTGRIEPGPAATPGRRRGSPRSTYA